jgi:poly-gamma-glutamate synthesis protein (capsule biosynthesis protein)
MVLNLTRRMLLGSGLALAAGCATPIAGTGRRTTRITLLGQSLVKHDLCAQSWPGRASVSARLRRADVVFSDLEVAIRGPNAGAPTRDALTLHTAEPGILDCLREMGVDLLATSNNHAFDLNTGGIVDAIAALRAGGIPFAGTGMNLTEASRPALVTTPGRPVALVAAASGKVREGGMATPERPGVNEIRRGSDGTLDAGDVERTLAAIRAAASQGAIVIFYLHNHHWEEPDNWVTPDWQRSLARAAVDAGAALFVAHGTPLLQGIETYRGRPLFHGLGSFIFQTIKEDFYDALAWQSAAVECRFEDGSFAGADLVPVQLNAEGVGGPSDMVTRGRPSLASPAEARIILERLALLSDRLGYRLVHDGLTARILP